jgi:hypothetical protein
MVRVRGRCPRGERLVSHVPQGDWTTITFIAGLRRNRMTAPMVIEGAMNGPAFLAYIERILGPALKRGDIVALDNLLVHKVAGVEEGLIGLIRLLTVRELSLSSTVTSPSKYKKRN